MPHGRACFALVLAVVMVGCESAPIPFRVKPAERGALTLPLDGPYEATIHSFFTGSVRVRVVARPTEEGFVAISRTRAAWPLVGGLEGLFGPLLVSGLFPGGVIMVWESTLPADGEEAYGKIGAGRAFSVPTVLRAADEPVEILFNGRRLGLMTLQPASTHAKSSRQEYREVAAAVERALGEHLFDPRLVRTSAVRSYLARLRRAADLAQDDLEFAFGAEVARRQIPLFSQVLLLRELDPELEDLLAQKPGVREALVTGSSGRRDGIAVVRADAFVSGADIDRVMAAVCQGEPAGLILDLRTARVGDLSALRVASWLLSEPISAGTVHPGGQDAARSPAHAIAQIDAENPEALRHAVERFSGVTVRVTPVDTPYTGPVVVLTSGVTASSAEALAALLQVTGRATLVGERTAGKMLVPERVSIAHGWVLQLPAFDYLGPDGTRIEDRGVEPDVRAAWSAAPRMAREILRVAAGSTSGP